MVAAPFRATHAAPARRADRVRVKARSSTSFNVSQPGGWRGRSAAGRRVIVAAVMSRPHARRRLRCTTCARASQGDTLHTCRRLLGNHSAAATARNLEPAGQHRGRSALPLLQRHQPRAGVSSGISLLSRTTNRSATWSDPLRPVHRQDVGACELPIGRELEHRRCRDEADGLVRTSVAGHCRFGREAAAPVRRRHEPGAHSSFAWNWDASTSLVGGCPVRRKRQPRIATTALMRRTGRAKSRREDGIASFGDRRANPRH
jgi:hypothetical protein